MEGVLKYGNEIWKSITFKPGYEAGRNGFSQSNINNCLKKRAKTHKGYKWYYLEDYEQTLKDALETCNLIDNLEVPQ